MNNINFIKDLLKMREMKPGSKVDAKKYAEFQKGISDGFLAQFPEEIQNDIKKTLENKSVNQVADELLTTEEDADEFMKVIEKALSFFGEQDPFDHEGVQVDPVMFFNSFQELKAKYDHYESSQDINNF